VEAQERRGASRPLVGTRDRAPTPCRVVHGYTPCSIVGVFAYPPGTVHSKDDSIGMSSGVTETGQHWND
jgi:hypothetical protein